ncbi:hypothetical protein HHI36_020292 [Cryptolaemus montrouzieri]|uniref:Uncharacterized protein n=1 Tax=Cryptolaemus montrouzieri TaxID=559131 RepID=A0ABD2N9T4_9CUCU
MKLLYDHGKGDVYRNSIKWLDSEDEELLATAIMAVGNFARNDENCIAIVKEGISKKLIDLLSKYSSNTPNIKLLHGLLSTLKNLVVPNANKSIILEEGLIKSMEPVLQLDNDIVIFKLLGTLRLVIDGQEEAAKDLISRKSFLQKLVEWYENTYHLGVKREVSRLLAWLIKSCHSWESMCNILQTERALNCLVSMFSSEDVIMENEALISLNILATLTWQTNESNTEGNISTETNFKLKFEEQMDQTHIETVIPYVRIFAHSEPMLRNLISLLEKLFQSKRILDRFKEKRISEILQENSKCVTSQNCLGGIQKLISLLSA